MSGRRKGTRTDAERAEEHVARALELALELIAFVESLSDGEEWDAVRSEVANDLRVICARLSRALHLLGGRGGRGL